MSVQTSSRNPVESAQKNAAAMTAKMSEEMLSLLQSRGPQRAITDLFTCQPPCGKLHMRSLPCKAMNRGPGWPGAGPPSSAAMRISMGPVQVDALTFAQGLQA